MNQFFPGKCECRQFYSALESDLHPGGSRIKRRGVMSLDIGFGKLILRTVWIMGWREARLKP